MPSPHHLFALKVEKHILHSEPPLTVTVSAGSVPAQPWAWMLRSVSYQ